MVDLATLLVGTLSVIVGGTLGAYSGWSRRGSWQFWARPAFGAGAMGLVSGLLASWKVYQAQPDGWFIALAMLFCFAYHAIGALGASLLGGFVSHQAGKKDFDHYLAGSVLGAACGYFISLKVLHWGLTNF